VIATCAAHIPIRSIPAHVRVFRGGKPLRGRGTPRHRLFLRVGDEIRVWQPGHFSFSYDGNNFWMPHGDARLVCRQVLVRPAARHKWKMLLVVWLHRGQIQVSTGDSPRHGVIMTREMTSFAISRGTHFAANRTPRLHTSEAWTWNKLIVAVKTSDQRLRINTRITYTAISDRKGIRLDIWPFSLSPLQRRTRPGDDLVPFWDDGRPCSVGCTAPGAIPGWPIKPFHRQHAIRAGLNELRGANFHVAVDIEAHDFQPVYALQSGHASIRYQGTGDVNVDVGNFYYWHIQPAVSDGQYVTAYKTVLGYVLNGFYHVALSEVDNGNYINPLRPGGSLRPYSDTEPPVIGKPQIFPDGRVIVAAFDPQSFVAKGFHYETPVLAPASLAWRLYDAHSHALTGLEWALRGSQNLPPYLRPVVFAPGATAPGFECFFKRRRCIPNWVYWLAGGLTPRLPLNNLSPGRYRLTVYAWDWAGNTSALDYWFRVPLGSSAAPAASEFGTLKPNFDYDETGTSGPPPSIRARPAHP
jgi:hypothetical protein